MKMFLSSLNTKNIGLFSVFVTWFCSYFKCYSIMLHSITLKFFMIMKWN